VLIPIARYITPKAAKRPQQVADNGKWKAEHEKQRREEAISNTTGIRVLAVISAAVPVRLMKRDLLFVVERVAAMLDENRLVIVAKHHRIKKEKDNDSITKLFVAFLRRTEEGMLGRVLVELTIVLAAAHSNAPKVLSEAAAVYKVDTDAIAAKVKQEFAAKAQKKLPVKAKPAKLKKTA
jgi:ParB family chromosome partitioning protein